MKFIDRQAEMQRLDRLAARAEGGLAVLWGRRRIGKTRLLLEWCRRHDGLYAVGDQSAPTVQRAYLAQALSTRFETLGEATYPDWTSLLRRIAREAGTTGWRGPLVLDEFPYWVQAGAELVSQFQRWIDGEARQAKLAVAIAGSSQRMMQGLVLDASSPLYGRAVELLEIGPLGAGFLREGLNLRDAISCVQSYAVWGGVPRYWELAEPYGPDLECAVDECVLDPLGPLHREPDRLLLEELPPAAACRPILDVIGMGAHRLSEIAGRLGKPATSLGHALSRIVDLGLVRREQPYGESEKSGKRSLYKIADPLFRCWFRIVAPHRALLAHASESVRRSLWREARASLFAEAWEELCRQAVVRIHEGSCPLAQYGPWKPAARYWQGDGPEWDVVTESLDGEHLLVGEVKWTDRPASHEVMDKAIGDLKAKGIPGCFRGRDRHILYAVFIPKTSSRSKRRGDVYVVDARDVLSSLTGKTES
ncbi:MAG TPA: ATP-binding protein [Sedimentisphaerales bacterium]|jgi:AAA+ ATPase superfamily predicted ATPase|nr:ATP-binding protein [Sedimentisphaerales bacterium]HNU27978.1 ATP-binding protein [Sedimentisphaerales bacterium]